MKYLLLGIAMLVGAGPVTQQESGLYQLESWILKYQLIEFVDTIR